MNNKNKYKIRQRIANQLCFSAEALYILADCVVFDQPKKTDSSSGDEKEVSYPNFFF